MNANIDHWIAEIDALTQSYKEALWNLNEQDLNWKPSQNQWSIAQILQHLIVINQSYEPVIEEIRSENFKPSLLARSGFIVKLFGKEVLKSVQPSSLKKIRTFPIWEPSQSNLNAEILNEFEARQEQLKELIKGCETLLKNDVVIFSPANRNIVYKLHMAFDIIVTHEKRHLVQAKALKAALTKEKNTD